jgi:hypothetical protein
VIGRITHPVLVEQDRREDRHHRRQLQGANDPRVPKVESDEVVAAVKKNGVSAEYYRVS